MWGRCSRGTFRDTLVKLVGENFGVDSTILKHILGGENDHWIEFNIFIVLFAHFLAKPFARTFLNVEECSIYFDLILDKED